jgi:beta-phosphoglucomutase-like phosphatase (HAD superfamily)
MRIKAILFDIDGTLVDSNDMHVLAWEEAFAGIGAAFDRHVRGRQAAGKQPKPGLGQGGSRGRTAAGGRRTASVA